MRPDITANTTTTKMPAVVPCRNIFGSCRQCSSVRPLIMLSAVTISSTEASACQLWRTALFFLLVFRTNASYDR
eukprot:scaffold291871_cov47-Prasinocladus_malaysianus.AAC.1